VLLSFIDVKHLQEIQSQLVFFKSMQKQYAAYGLKIILIDESYYQNDLYRSNVLSNFVEDNELNDVVLLLDNKRENAARKYGVYKSLATFLISRDGFIQRSWGNTALSAELAIAIENDLNDRPIVKHFN
jgi:peroxiredoxin